MLRMFDFIRRRQNIEILLDRSQHFEKRWKALYALTSIGAHPDSIGAMLKVASEEPDEYLFAEELIHQIALFNNRDATSALLVFLKSESLRGPTRQLEYVLSYLLNYCDNGFAALGDAAI